MCWVENAIFFGLLRGVRTRRRRRFRIACGCVEPMFLNVPRRGGPMTPKRRLSDSGVSRRDLIRIGAGGLGFGLFGGLGPVPYVLRKASLAAAAAQSGKI